MKVILYMAMTVNGMVAGEGDDTSWTSEEDWESFIKKTEEIGNLVIGRRTYELMLREGSIDYFKKPLTIIVVCRQKRYKTNYHSKHKVLVTHSPQAAIKILEGTNFRKVLVAGGGKLNASFMREGLIDEIYLDIEPKILGEGIRLFAEGDFNAYLELLGVRNLSSQTIQLHYRVKR